MSSSRRASPLVRAAALVRRERAPGAVHPAALVAVALAAPAVAYAHERWVPHAPRFPVNRAFFQSMTGEVLLYSLGASLAIFGVIVLWYLSAPGVVDALTPVVASARAREAARPAPVRAARLFARLLLDGPVDGAFMRHGRRAATFFFARIPAFVFALGAYQGWLVMPSYPLPANDLGNALRGLEVALAVWTASGLFLPPLGAILILVYAYLGFAYGIAAIDAIPVLASAFYYLFSRPKRDITVRQLLGVRVSLGAGFFLLGLVNKIYLAPDLFVGVGDQHPDLLIGPQTMFPGFTREAWSFTTALGEMVFGLLLLFGIFNRITTLVLSLVFANFVLFFGAAEIVHVYPIAGFLLLFFRGPSGAALDGLLFRINLGFWRTLRRTSSRLVYGGAVTAVAAFAGGVLMFLPLLLITEVVPAIAGTEVPDSYRSPPLPPPASAWPLPGAPHADHAARHGGIVTMSGDLHIEIVVASSGSIALYLSDALRTPIPPTQASGSMRIERPGSKTVVALRPDAAGALSGVGPPPRLPTDYTYVLQIRGVAASMTLAVPPGGTEPLVRRAGGMK